MPKNTPKTSKPDPAELLEAAISTLESAEGFQQWLRFRASFANYSLNNTLLIMKQRPNAALVAGFGRWRDEFSRTVKKGERAIWILAPNIYKSKDLSETGEEIESTRIKGFRQVAVFDVSQTEGEPLPAPPECQPLTGESHAHLIPQLTTYAQTLGYRVTFAELPTANGGYCNYATKTITVNKNNSRNATVHVLVHELIHALGASSKVFGAEQAETIADSAAFIVCSALGLDTSGFSAPYIAGWSTKELRTQAIGFIDYYAATLERELGLHERRVASPAPLTEQAAA